MGVSALEYSDEFEVFWVAYPKKRSKRDAWRAWQQTTDRRPSLIDVVTKIGCLSITRQWVDNNGQFIPHPATWLRADGWDDEVEVAVCRPLQIGATPDWHGMWSREDETSYRDHPRWTEYTDEMMDWQDAAPRPSFEAWVGA